MVGVPVGTTVAVGVAVRVGVSVPFGVQVRDRVVPGPRWCPAAGNGGARTVPVPLADGVPRQGSRCGFHAGNDPGRGTDQRGSLPARYPLVRPLTRIFLYDL